MTFICETCVATGDNKCRTDGAHLGRELRAWGLRYKAEMDAKAV